MKVEVTRSCGHEETIEVYGPNSSRERKIAAMERTECTHCRAEKARQSGITEGSDKQVAWAFDIREQMKERISDFLAECESFAKRNGKEDEMHSIRENFAQAVENLALASKASWFIDHQRDSAKNIVFAAYNKQF